MENGKGEGVSKVATSADILAGNARWSVTQSDCIEWLRSLPDNSVHCCVTSPPYFALRSYLPHDHPAKSLEVGSEESPERYVARMADVFREVRRVLHPSGSMFLNLGDSYSSSPPGCKGVSGSSNLNGVNSESGTYRDRLEKGTGAKRDTSKLPGIKPKDLIGVPWMVAFALRADGWWLRGHCPWVKRNPMPESVTDRPGTACEEVFLLAKQPDYFFDMEAVKRRATTGANGSSFTDARDHATKPNLGTGPRAGDNGSRNFRNSDLWFDSVGLLMGDDGELLGFDVTTKPYKGSHFAVMPKAIVEPCILAGTSAKGVCPECGEPWRRQVTKTRKATRPGTGSKVTLSALKLPAEEPGRNRGEARFERSTLGQVVGNRDPERHCTTTETTGWAAGCKCDAGEPVPAVVIDPFTGSGTVLAVAVEKGRRAMGSELNPAYIGLIHNRMAKVNPPLFTEAA